MILIDICSDTSFVQLVPWVTADGPIVQDVVVWIAKAVVYSHQSFISEIVSQRMHVIVAHCYLWLHAVCVMLSDSLLEVVVQVLVISSELGHHWASVVKDVAIEVQAVQHVLIELVEAWRGALSGAVDHLLDIGDVNVLNASSWRGCCSRLMDDAIRLRVIDSILGEQAVDHVLKVLILSRVTVFHAAETIKTELIHLLLPQVSILLIQVVWVTKLPAPQVAHLVIQRLIMREIIIFVVISEVLAFSLVTILVLAIITSLVEQWWV